MKYIRTHEELSYDELDEKRDKYNKYRYKYVIYQYHNNIGYGNVVLIESDFTVWIDVYNIIGQPITCHGFDLEKLEILHSFKTKEEAMEEMKFYRDSTKYNL
jgi:hypothetical protein